jgi:uncharacterized membrane protein (DUF485 family)
LHHFCTALFALHYLHCTIFALHHFSIMHHPANTTEHEEIHVIAKRQRIGVILLLFFTLAYASFIGLCTFAYEWITQTKIAGIPLTVAYGVGLILLSLVIAMLYGLLSRTRS